MAAEYAALCVAANDRLRKCTGSSSRDSPHRGHPHRRGNPNLLDLVSQLDLPDPQAWAEFCQNNGFPVPPALQLDRARPAQRGLRPGSAPRTPPRRHRLLALSRAPVRERLDVMRKIAQIDVGSATWKRTSASSSRPASRKSPARSTTPSRITTTTPSPG